MEYVEPIRDIAKIKEIKNILLKKSLRDYTLFVLGINTGLRSSELLSLKISEVYDFDRDCVKEFLCPESRKGKAYSDFYLNDQVKEALSTYIKNTSFSSSDFLFKSAKNYSSPITRQQAYRIILQAVRDAGIEDKIGTHTLRKTFGYHAYRKGVAISLLQKIFHHTTKAETLAYIGVKSVKQNDVRVDVNL